MLLCFIELCLRLLAARAAPVVGQVLKCHTVVFGWIVQIATDRADIFAGVFLLGEIYLGKDCRHGIVEIHHALGLQVLITLRRVGAAIYGRLMANELTYTIHRFASGRQVVEDNGKFVRIKSLVNVGDVSLEHIEQSLVLCDDEAVTVSMPLGLDKVNTIGNLLTLWEVVISAISKLYRHDVWNVLEFVCPNFFCIHINLCIGEGTQLS